MADEPQVIVIQESILQSLARDAGTFTIFVTLIGVGLWVGSNAMQWVGAIVAFIVISTRASGLTKRHRMTRKAAILMLQEQDAAK